MVHPVFGCLTLCLAARESGVAGEQLLFQFAQGGERHLVWQFAANFPGGRERVPHSKLQAVAGHVHAQNGSIMHALGVEHFSIRPNQVKAR